MNAGNCLHKHFITVRVIMRRWVFLFFWSSDLRSYLKQDLNPR